MVRPAYSRMQIIVSDALLKERDRVIKKVALHLDRRVKKELDALLETDDSFYQITLLKKDPKDFSTSEMRSEVAKNQRLLKIYNLTKSDILNRLPLPCPYQVYQGNQLRTCTCGSDGCVLFHCSH